MKKKLLITFLAIYSVALNAQINITSANNIFVSGNSYITDSDDSVTSYGAAGANQTWDFSSWTNTGLDTTLFQAPSNLAGASFFPNATVGVGGNGTASFLKTTSTACEILGFYADFGGGLAPVTFNPAQTFLTFPSTYQTSFSGSTSYSISLISSQPGIDSIKSMQQTSFTSVIDAWGTLSTPAYSNLSVLRQYVTEITKDTTFVILTGDSVWTYLEDYSSTTFIYRWWSNAHGHPVAEITFGIGDTHFYGNYLTATLVGVNELAKNTNAISVFPSPAADKVTFKGIDSDSYLLVFDVNGKLVDKSLLRKNTTINVANYNNGVYFYNVAPLNGTTVSKGKFVVEK